MLCCMGTYRSILSSCVVTMFLSEQGLSVCMLLFVLYSEKFHFWYFVWQAMDTEISIRVLQYLDS